jgi:hypothetical protein
MTCTRGHQSRGDAVIYVVATCTGTILRRQTGVNQFGDANGQYVAVATGVIAAVQESNNTVYDQATQTPRTLRSISGIFPSNTDLRQLDQFRDDTHQVTYVVNDVTLNHAPGHQPDLDADLKKVTGG